MNHCYACEATEEVPFSAFADSSGNKRKSNSECRRCNSNYQLCEWYIMKIFPYNVSQLCFVFERCFKTLIIN